MKTKYWLEDISPKQVFNKFVKSEVPNATLWDLFTDYEPTIYTEEPADKSEKWLEKQELIVDKIIEEHLQNVAFTILDLEYFTAAIEEYCLPEDDQDIDFITSKHKELAFKIAKTYIIPEQLNENTRNQLLEILEKKLKTKNKASIEASGKEVLIENIRKIDYYTDEKKEELVKNLENMWANAPEDAFEEDEFEYENYEDNSPQFIYPTFPLAHSNTFYGFDDAGNLSYEEQDALAQEKFNQYKDEISELLGLQPSAELQPKVLDYDKEGTDELWEAYYALQDSDSFIYQFDGEFEIWKGKDKIMFLSMNKEDKELPFEIELGGLTLDAYLEIIKKYNELIEKIHNT